MSISSHFRRTVAYASSNFAAWKALKGVFDMKADSGYEDEAACRYHFPDRYLPVARALVGDWILYREPRRNAGRQGYVAVARVERIEAAADKHSFAIVSEYLPFDRPVPFVLNGIYAEAPLRAIDDHKRVGAALQGKSVREIFEEDFASIARQGLRDTLDPANAARLGLSPASLDVETRSLIDMPLEAQKREIVSILVNRKIRDAKVRADVRDAYVNQCAFTRLEIIDHEGNVEAVGAHIWPVASGGPDTIQNGIALSQCVHWLFDHHLLSVTEDYRPMISDRVPAALRRLLIDTSERILLPADRVKWPSRAYLAKHRAAFEVVNGAPVIVEA